MFTKYSPAHGAVHGQRGSHDSRLDEAQARAEADVGRAQQGRTSKSPLNDACCIRAETLRQTLYFHLEIYNTIENVLVFSYINISIEK